MAQLLSDEDLVPQKPVAQKSAVPGLLSDEELQPRARSPLEKFPLAQYPVEYTTAGLEAAKEGGAQALRGAGAGIASSSRRQVELINRIDAGERPSLREINEKYGGDTYGYLNMTPEQKVRWKAEWMPELTIKTADQPLYRAGEAVSGFGQSVVGAAPGWEGSFTRDLGGATGSTASTALVGLIPGVGPAAVPWMVTAQGQGEAAQRAVKAGASEEQISTALAPGAVAGSTDLVDALLPHFGGSLGKAAGFVGKVAEKLGPRGVRMLKAGLAEGAQEATQQTIQNLGEKAAYNPEKDIRDDVGYSALLGFLAGGTVSGLLGGSGKDQRITTPEDVGLRSGVSEEEALQSLTGEEPSTEGRGGTVRSPPGAPTAAPAPEAPAAPTTEPVLPTEIPTPPEPPLAPDPALVPPGPQPVIVQTPNGPVQVLTQPPDPYVEYRLPSETLARVQAGTDEIVEGIRNRFINARLGNTPLIQNLPAAAPTESQLELPLSNMQDNQRPLAATSETPVEGTYEPSTISIAPAGMAGELVRIPITEQDLPSVGQGGTQEVYRDFTKGTAQQPSDAVVTTLHTTTLSNWLDTVHPAAPLDDLNTVMHRHMVGQLKRSAGNTPVHIVTDSEFDRVIKHPEFAAAYQPLVDLGIMKFNSGIYMRARNLADSRTFSHFLMHEGVHAGTLETLRAGDARAFSFRSQIKTLMLEVQRKAFNSDTYRIIAYGMTNEEEFIAEALSNPKFQHVLGNIRVSKEIQRQLGISGPRPTVWQALVRAIHGALGLESNLETMTLLEASMRVGDRIMDAQARLPGSAARPDTASYVEGYSENRRELNKESPDVPAVGQQPEFMGVRQRLDELYSPAGMKLTMPPQLKQAGAHADRMNKLYKWTAGLDQIARSNPNFTPLRLYRDAVALMHRVEVGYHNQAIEMLKQWRKLNDDESRGLTHFIDDIAHMSYRDPVEVNAGVVRHPSQQEFQKLARKHGIWGNRAALAMFYNLNIHYVGRGGVGGILGDIETALVNRIQRSGLDPAEKLTRIATARRQAAELRARPYFPWTNFGNHYLLVKDPAGKLVHYETVTGRVGLGKIRQATRYDQLAKDWKQFYGRAPVHGQDILTGVLKDNAEPIVGQPSMLTDPLVGVMKMTPDMINTQLWQQVAQVQNAQPVLHPRFQKKYHVPGYGLNLRGIGGAKGGGYSMDLRRSFARHAFHGARYLTRLQFMDQLEAHIKDADAIVKQYGGKKNRQIVDYMQDHLDNTIKDGRGDWGHLKAAIFIWTMGYVPAAATQNLTQLPMITYPHLAGKFGDAQTTKELLKQMANYRTFTKEGKLKGATDFDLRAMGYAVETGRVSDTQAPELAAASQSKIFNNIDGNKFQKGFSKFVEWAPLMFELAEQANRRITFATALQLAIKNPQAKYVDQAARYYQGEYADLKNRGYSDAQARVIVTAIDAVEQTQYVYARWARPRFMRGPLPGTILVFQKYLQSTLWWFSQQNLGTQIRYALIMMALGGVGGLPGWEELQGILRAIGNNIYGKDFRLEHEVRKLINDMFGNKPGEEAKFSPDMIMHGLSAKGFGWPALLDLLGSFATGTPGRGFAAPRTVTDDTTGEQRKEGFAKNVPFPVLDRSRAISLRLLPFDVGKWGAPTKDIDDTISQQVQQAVGAFFSAGFNIYKAIFDSKHDKLDWKRWERAVPRLLGDAGEAFEALHKGRVRGRGGPEGGTTVVPYDVRDTEQMMEILATAMGYQTARKQNTWNLIMAQADVVREFDLRRTGLMEAYHEAISGGKDDEMDRAIDAIEEYNRDLPPELAGKSISAAQLRQSIGGRTKGGAQQELNIPRKKGDYEIYMRLRQLYPESSTDLRRAQ